MDNAEITFSENTRSESTWLKSSFSPVFLGSCLISALLVFASLLLPSLTSSFLSRAGDFYLAKFPYWIIWSVALIFIFSIAFAVIPTIGSRKLGLSDESTQYSFFSWFSMIFGTGMGIGLLTWGIAEPIAGLQNNPDVIRALTTAGTSDNTSSALKWSYAHWGFAGWASYAIVGLAVGYTGHRQRLPLTLRTALVPLFGDTMKGWFGHLIDMLTIIATVFGIVQVLGYALNESVMAFALTNDAHWLLDEKGNATALSKLAASTFIFILAAASAVSGISRGIKWLSNTNMILSLIFLATILLASSFKGALSTLLVSVFDYLINLPSMTFDVWRKDGTEIGDGLQAWQGTWSMYHWAGWWLSFSPFIGIFLARISKGRSIRQYLFATIVLPAVLTMIWMSWAGGHAIALELNGSANGELINTAVGLKIFSLIQLMFEPVGVWLVSMLLILLLVTYLTTTIDSAIIVSTSVLSKGTPGKEKNKATLVVSLILALVMALLIYADGFSPIRSAMVVASAPISALIVTLCLSISIAIYRDPVLK